jgi:hypothetical protein
MESLQQALTPRPNKHPPSSRQPRAGGRGNQHGLRQRMGRPTTPRTPGTCADVADGSRCADGSLPKVCVDLNARDGGGMTGRVSGRKATATGRWLAHDVLSPPTTIAAGQPCTSPQLQGPPLSKQQASHAGAAGAATPASCGWRAWAHLWRQPRGGGLLQYLLVAPLYRAVAVKQIHRAAMQVRHHLSRRDAATGGRGNGRPASTRRRTLGGRQNALDSSPVPHPTRAARRSNFKSSAPQGTPGASWWRLGQRRRGTERGVPTCTSTCRGRVMKRSSSSLSSLKAAMASRRADATAAPSSPFGGRPRREQGL